MYQLLSSLEHGRNFDSIPAFSDQHVLHVDDSFDQEYVNKILQKGTPRCIISDQFTKSQFEGLEVFGIPLYFNMINEIFIKNQNYNNNFDTNVAFNFMINKKQINRFLCMKLVELFELKNFDYTWSGQDRNFDMSHTIAELNDLGTNSPLDQVSKSFILRPVELKKRWVDIPGQVEVHDQFIKNPPMGLDYRWKSGLGNMFSQSAVSLITESVWTQKGSVFTEKTMYAVLGLTFPIWIGGYEQAKEFSRMGFDIFDDIVDHSYQSHGTVIERCYYAIERNLDLLSNLDKLRDLRLQNKNRLIKNREVLTKGHLRQYIDQQIAALPADLLPLMPQILKYFKRQDQ